MNSSLANQDLFDTQRLAQAFIPGFIRLYCNNNSAIVNSVSVGYNAVNNLSNLNNYVLSIIIQCVKLIILLLCSVRCNEQ